MSPTLITWLLFWDTLEIFKRTVFGIEVGRATHTLWLVHDLHTAKGDTKPVSRLVLDSRVVLPSVRAEKTLKSLSFAEAARYLVTLLLMKQRTKNIQ